MTLPHPENHHLKRNGFFSVYMCWPGDKILCALEWGSGQQTVLTKVSAKGMIVEFYMTFLLLLRTVCMQKKSETDFF